MKRQYDTGKKIALFCLSLLMMWVIVPKTVQAQEPQQDILTEQENMEQNSDEGTVEENGGETVQADEEQTELPGHLEPTEKIAKLELTKHDPVEFSQTSLTAYSAVPRTGDDSSAVLWVSLLAAAAVGIVVIWIIRKRK